LRIRGAITLDELDTNPYPAYKKLQDSETVVWVEAVQRRMVTRWDDVIHVGTNEEIFSAVHRRREPRGGWMISSASVGGEAFPRRAKPWTVTTGKSRYEQYEHR
jgi:hypothetical protein